MTATATVTQSSIKAPYDLKTVAGKYPNEYSPTGTDYNILAMSTIAGQNTVGQSYHNDDELRILYAATDDLEAIKVPYGATTVKIKTSDDVAVQISYWYLLDTTDIVTYSSKNLPKEISKTTWFNTNTGGTVEYGQAVVFRPTDAQLPTLSYVYFE